MTAFDRLEPELPGLMDELAAARVPDYFDDLLTRTARTRQRPAWSSLERWLPMGVIARPALVPRLPWRSIAVLVILGLLIAAALLAVASGSRQRLPAPFGPARNGSILYSTAGGDIHSVDPITGASRAVVTGSASDRGPMLSHDGTRFLFVRTGDAPTNALLVANIDGSGVRQLFEGQFGLSVHVDGVAVLAPAPFSWSPDGTHVAVTSTIDQIRKVTVVATDGSAATTLELGMSVSNVSWRPNGKELVFVGEDSEASGTTYGLYLVNADGRGLRPILPANSLEFGWQSPTLSPDGTTVAFARWGGGLSQDGINIVDVSSGATRVLDFEGQVDSDEYLPEFSPDGTHLAFARFLNGEYQLAVVPVGGGGQAVPIGPRFSEATAEPFLSFSPDGALILGNYPADGSTWLLNVAGGNDRQMSWPPGEFQSWQRLAL
jgi:Tol biopolymer transport system component